MNDDEFINVGNNLCSSLSVMLKNEIALGGPHSAICDHDFNGNILHIKIEQCRVRTINISSASPVSMINLWDFYTEIERLLMLLDGRFYIIESAVFTGYACSEAYYSSYVQECMSRRLSCCKTDSAYRYPDHRFLMYDIVLSSELISKWMKLQDELDIVNQVVLYNIADTGITHDVKCANFIEGFEPMAEVIGIYDKFFPRLKPGDRTTTLKMCIDAVISKYGQDIFAEEYSVNKDKFLQTLVNTRNRIMHIKRNQPTEKHLSGTESILYLVKLCHLYRVVIFLLLEIDYDKYRPAVVKSVEQWNSWNNVLINFKNAIR